ncbi:MAG: histidine--tRNA ligase [Ignavibacteriales bacterium]|nr:histidine--tRNA ligase [Ignavibacteriales bacterium]
MKFRSIRGTKDVLPGETEAWQYVEETIRRVMGIFNYREIRTPVFEQTGLFARSIGELTDIVSKEMYTFSDRSEESLTLRPEGTASALRAYIQHNVGEQTPLTKLYYIGPMFRQERPQAGRLRQFHQFGAEALGSSSPQLDAEMMLLALSVYRELGIQEFSLKINSVGCEQCRPPYKLKLIESLQTVRNQLSPESQARIDQNPLRVLDSKDEHDQALTNQVPLMKDHLCPECSRHFAEVQTLLQATATPFVIDGRLVRGLDYYTKTAFEITSTALGSQDALAGGGRYDLLVEELGGKQTPGVGFAAGIERLLMVLAKIGPQRTTDLRPLLFIVTIDEEARRWAFAKAHALRTKGMRIEVDYLGRSVKAQMREANRQEALYTVVIGETELRSGSAKLKNMRTGDDVPVNLNEIDSALQT